MTIAYRLDGALLPFESVRFNPEAGAIFPSTAWYGEPQVAGVIIEDTSGSLDIDGWHTFTVEETACSKPRIFTGWIAGKEISRGRDSNRVGAARVWNCDIVDQNHIFSLEVFRSSAASVRPAETDVARIQAMIASHAMGGTPIYDNGRLNTAGPLNLSPANFVTQYPAEMLRSTAGQCAKNGYAYWSDADQQISIHYDAVGSGPAATITFSNVPGDYGPIESASTTCFAPSSDATLKEDPYHLYTGFLLGYAGGYTYQRNTDLIDDLSPNEFSPVNFLRDQYENSTRIGRATTAATYTASQLARYGVEAVTLNFSVILPARAVNLAHAGDLVTVRFSHLPGYESNTAVTVIRRSVRPIDGHDALYEVQYECADFEGAEVGGGGGGPFQSGSCTPSLVQISSQGHDNPLTSTNWPTFSATPTVGNLMVACVTAIASSGEQVNPTGFTGLGAGWTYDPSGTKDLGQRLFYRIVQTGDDAVIELTVSGGTVTEHASFVAEFDLAGATVGAFEDTLDDTDQTDPQDFPFDAAATTDNVPILAIASMFPSLNVNDAWDPVEQTGAILIGRSGVGGISAGGDEPKSWFGYKAYDDTGGATVDFEVDNENPSGISRGHAGLIQVFSGTCGSTSIIPPLPGQTVPGSAPNETPNGTEDEFTAPTGGYQPGSMEVSFNGSWLESGRDYTEADSETGTVTFTNPPPANAQIVLRYRGL